MVGSDSGERPADARLSWTWGVGHNYIGLFLTALFLDQLAVGTLTVGGLVPSLIGAALGGLLAFGLLYYPAASWGLQGRVGLDRVASATFGERGARWLPGLPMALAQVVWFAAGLALAADYGQRGLLLLGLLEPKDVADWALGPLSVKAPVVLFEMVCWGVFAAVMGALLVRVVTAVSYTYPIFPALAIAAAFFLTLPGIGGTRLAGDGLTAIPKMGGVVVAAITMVQLVTGFFAPSGLLGADWGAVSRSRRDVALGGLVGIGLASTILAALSLTIVADTLVGPADGAIEEPAPAQETADARLARLLGGSTGPASPAPALPVEAGGPSLGAALQYGLGGPAAGVVLLVLALGLLGPCVYAPYLFSKYAGNFLPGVKPLRLALASVPAAWLLASLGWADSLPRIFGWMGAAFGPVAGAIAADFVRQKGRWPGPRPGWRASAAIAWAVGLAAGLAPEFGLGWVQPATVLAFSSAFLVELVLGRRLAGPVQPVGGS